MPETFKSANSVAKISFVTWGKKAKSKAVVEDIDVGFGRQEFDHKLKLAKVEKKSDQESQDDRDVRSIHCNLSASAARSEV